jgi:bacterioferritin
MANSQEIVAKLNGILSIYLTAINQFFIHAEMCRDWNYNKLYERFRNQSVAAMVAAEKVIRRILYLKGQPNLSDYQKIKIGNSVSKQLKNDLKIERDLLKILNKAEELSRNKKDDGTRQILKKLVSDEEEYIDWLEAQLGQIESVGLANYLAYQIHK